MYTANRIRRGGQSEPSRATGLRSERFQAATAAGGLCYNVEPFAYRPGPARGMCGLGSITPDMERLSDAHYSSVLRPIMLSAFATTLDTSSKSSVLRNRLPSPGTIAPPARYEPRFGRDSSQLIGGQHAANGGQDEDRS